MTQAANLAALAGSINSSGQLSLSTGTTGSLARGSMPSGSVIQTVTSNSAVNTNITITNPTSPQSPLYNTTIPNRVYGDLTSLTITPTNAANKFLFLGTSGMSSGVASINGACGAIFVVNNSTGVGFFGDYPWYAAYYSIGGGSRPGNYFPDITVSAYYSPASASAFTVYFKGYSYSEGNTQTTNFRNAFLTVMEIAA
jgi:hypothetical protein